MSRTKLNLVDARDFYESRYKQALADGQLDPETVVEADYELAAQLVELLALDEGVSLFNTQEMLKRAVAEAEEQ